MATDRTNTLSDRTSRALTVMQAVLAVMVVCAHSPLTPPHELSAYGVSVVSTMPELVVMPGFFLISGYLFFICADRFGPDEYRLALRKRVRTLLVPYIAWCAISWCARAIAEPAAAHPPLYHLAQVFFPGFNGIPYGMGLLWYINQLMALCLLSPLVYMAVRLLRVWAIPLALVLWMLLRMPGAGVNHNDFLAFFVGAALAINRVDFISICGRLLTPVAILWLAVTPFFVHFTTWDYRSRISPDAFGALELSYIILSVLLLAALSARIADFTPGGDDHPRRRRLFSAIATLAPFTFFIYVTHTLPQVESIFLSISAAAEPWLPEGSAGHDLLYYTLLVPVRLALLVGMGTLLARLAPGVWSALTGGRGDRRRAPRKAAVATD